MSEKWLCFDCGDHMAPDKATGMPQCVSCRNFYSQADAEADRTWFYESMLDSGYAVDLASGLADDVVSNHALLSQREFPADDPRRRGSMTRGVPKLHMAWRASERSD